MERDEMDKLVAIVVRLNNLICVAHTRSRKLRQTKSGQ